MSEFEESTSAETKKPESELTPEILWQSAFDSLWEQIAPFVMGSAQREALGIPPCKWNEVFMCGGRSSGKSFTAAEFIAIALQNDSTKNAVVIRKVRASIKNSCFEQMKKAIIKLGQRSLWSVNKTTLELRNTITGQKIIFVGLDDEEKVRSLTIEQGYFSIVWFEEAKQFSSYEEMIQAQASILRGSANGGLDNSGEDDAGGAAEFMTFVTYNPPKSMHDWINEEAATPKEGRIVHHSTYLTMPKAWVGSNIIAEAERLKRHNPRMYEYIYLGKAVGVDSTWFRNIEIREITEEERASFPYFDMGIDWGELDPNVFCKVYDDGEGNVYVFDEVYQDELPLDGSPKIKEFARLVAEKVRDCKDDPIYADAQDKQSPVILNGPPYNLYVQCNTPKHGENGRKEGYVYLQKRSKIVICSKTAPKIGRDFLRFEADKRPDGTPIDRPGRKGDHGPDAVRYALWQTIG